MTLDVNYKAQLFIDGAFWREMPLEVDVVCSDGRYSIIRFKRLAIQNVTIDGTLSADLVADGVRVDVLLSEYVTVNYQDSLHLDNIRFSIQDGGLLVKTIERLDKSIDESQLIELRISRDIVTKALESL